VAESLVSGVTVMLLANEGKPAFSSIFGDNVLEHCVCDRGSAAGVAGRPSGTEASELEAGEADVTVDADVPIGGRSGILLKTDGGLAAAAAAPVRQCNFCRLTLRDDGGWLDWAFRDIFRQPMPHKQHLQ